VVRSRDPFYDAALWHTDREAGYWVLSNHDLGFVHQVLTFVRRQAGTRGQFSRDSNSSEPEMILLLIRYGPTVLSAEEYRRVLRRHLWAYVWWHVRQLPRPSRLRQAKFFGLHRAQIVRILEEAGEDDEVRLAMRTIETMLRRRTRAVPEGAGLPRQETARCLSFGGTVHVGRKKSRTTLWRPSPYGYSLISLRARRCRPRVNLRNVVQASTTSRASRSGE
jgi:hypothetical protein